MAKRRLTDAEWASIRQFWEYEPTHPSYVQAALLASEKFGFTPPGKSSIADRASKEKWERKGSMAGVNAAAQRKADTLSGQPDAQPDAQPDGSGTKKGGAKPDTPPSPEVEQSAREDAENLRAQVLARHRQEWQQVAQLRQEALKKRHHPQLQPGGDDKAAFDKAKLAKITAEMTAIQQHGERKAWGLDIVVDPDQLKSMSEEDLALLAAGKAPRGMR